MKKTLHIYIILFGFIIASCRSGETKSKSFTFIDLTYSNGWTELVRIHLDSNKYVRIQLDQLNKNKIFLVDTLPDSTFIKIDSLASVVLSMQHDTLNGETVPDGGACNVIIKSTSKEINIMNWAGASCCDQMHRLMYNVIKLKDKAKNISTDTTFVFPSYWRLAPPPMADSVEIVRPIIIDDK